jgi:ketosteroid isomerase-like protein
MSVNYQNIAGFHLESRLTLYHNYLRDARLAGTPYATGVRANLCRGVLTPFNQEARMQMTADPNQITGTILALERAAMDRFNRGDVEGCIELYADHVTYFDPITEKRIDGLPAVAEYFRTFFAGKLDIPRYEILNPQVITDGDLAVLSYNLANYVRAEDGSETAGTPWNSTQVYRRTGDRWRVAHVHWSFTRHPAATQGLMA